MNVSLNHHSVTWVTVGWINFSIDIKKYYKVDVIGKYGEYFLFIPEAFSVDISLPSANLIMTK